MSNSKRYTAGIVVIGNEILSGRTQDTNTNWIADRLTQHGVSLAEVRVIPDIREKIIKTINAMRAEVDYVFTTGGIGPTHDDITAESIAEAFSAPLEQNEEAYKMLEQHYGSEELTEARLKMALIPKGATLIPNPVSAAPGFILENVHVMAGVPRIMQAMFDNVIVMLRGGEPVLSNTIVCSIPESELAGDLGKLQEKYPSIDIGSYPNFRSGGLSLSVVMRSVDSAVLKQATLELITIIRMHGGEPSAISPSIHIDDLEED